MLKLFYNLSLICFTHVNSVKRWGTISSSITKNEHKSEVVLLKRNNLLSKGKLMQIWKSANIFALTWKWYGMYVIQYVIQRYILKVA